MIFKSFILPFFKQIHVCMFVYTPSISEIANNIGGRRYWRVSTQEHYWHWQHVVTMVSMLSFNQHMDYGTKLGHCSALLISDTSISRESVYFAFQWMIPICSINDMMFDKIWAVA